jgi:hypothetical protein
LKGIPLAQIFGRNEKELSKISEELNSLFYGPLEDADLYIICVSDNSVEEVSKMITKKIVWLPILQDHYLKKSWPANTENPVFILYRPFQNPKNWNMKKFRFSSKLKMKRIKKHFLSCFQFQKCNGK